MPGHKNPKYPGAKGSNRFAAIVKGSFSFQNYHEAKEILDWVRAQFSLSKDSDPEDETSVILWIHGFGLTNAEVKEGYRGNFGRIKILQLGNGKWTLHASKIDRDLKYHPTRRRPKLQLPDWGHPFLRRVNTKKVSFPSEKEAWLALRALQEEYPKVAYPINNVLYIQIFRRGDKPPVRKYILEIKPAGDRFVIEARLNPHQGRIPRHKIDEVYDGIAMDL